MEEHGLTKVKSPMEYLRIFFRRKWFFIAPAFAGLVLGIFASFIMPPTYESYTVILVEEEKIINPLIQGLAVSTTAAQRMQSIRELLLGWNSLVELAKRLNLAKDVQSQMGFENLILGLRRNISVKMQGHNIIRISYFNKDPERTQIVTKALTGILVDENMRIQAKEADVAIGFINEQLEVYKRKVKEAEIADLEEKLKDLLADSTEQHPLVKELRHKISIARKELESGKYKVAISKAAADSATYKALKQELDKVTSEQSLEASSLDSVAYAYNAEPNEETNRALYKLILIDKLDTTVARDKNINEKIYNMLLEKLETAKITQRLEASKQGTRYTVLDPPRLPLKPAGPNKVKVIFLGFLMGSCAGTGFVFGREFFDQSFIDIEDAKANLSLPVLGGISRITTQEELDREKRRKRLAINFSLALSIALIIIGVLIALLRK